MRILITNISMEGRSGTRIFVRDLALELLRQGHTVALFTLMRGEITAELQQAGVEVRTCLKKIQMQPQIIHGNHPHVTNAALGRFKAVPAVYVCHNHELPLDIPLIHPRIHAYFGVSRICLDRIIDCGAPKNKVHTLYNSVDLNRFQPRSIPLPGRPRRALLFSNYANSTTQLPAVREACRLSGIELDVVGLGVGNPCAAPEHILGKYDLVFAKAKAAIEAMATGAAVILCDFGGTGPMVSSRNFRALQQHNFGFRVLVNPLDPEIIVKQISRYDPTDAAVVCDLTRNQHSLKQMVSYLTSFYHLAASLPAQASTEPQISYSRLLRDKTILHLLQLHLTLRGTKAGKLLRATPKIAFAQKTYWRLIGAP